MNEAPEASDQPVFDTLPTAKEMIEDSDDNPPLWAIVIDGEYAMSPLNKKHLVQVYKRKKTRWEQGKGLPGLARIIPGGEPPTCWVGFTQELKIPMVCNNGHFGGAYCVLKDDPRKNPNDKWVQRRVVDELQSPIVAWVEYGVDGPLPEVDSVPTVSFTEAVLLRAIFSTNRAVGIIKDFDDIRKGLGKELLDVDALRAAVSAWHSRVMRTDYQMGPRGHGRIGQGGPVGSYSKDLAFVQRMTTASNSPSLATYAAKMGGRLDPYAQSEETFQKLSEASDKIRQFHDIGQCATVDCPECGKPIIVTTRRLDVQEEDAWAGYCRSQKRNPEYDPDNTQAHRWDNKKVIKCNGAYRGEQPTSETSPSPAYHWEANAPDGEYFGY